MAGKLASELNAGCQCTTYTAASVTAQRAQNRWGWGETLTLNLMAQQTATKLLALPGNTRTLRVSVEREHPDRPKLNARIGPT